MADGPSFFVTTTTPGGESTEYVSGHPLDTALYIMRADQRGLSYRVSAVDDTRAREISLAELAASEPAPGLAAEMWHNARAAWLRHHLHVPADPGAPWGPDWEGAAARWAATFRAPLPEGIEDAVALPDPAGRGWDLVHQRVGQLLELLEHESQWRDPGRASYPEWSAREYQQAWRQLRAHTDSAPALDTTADFFLRMALERDLRAGAVEGFLGVGHPGLERWARVAYRYGDEDELRPGGDDREFSDSREEAARLFAAYTADGAPLTEEERAWAARWPRDRNPDLRRDWEPDGEEAQREFWQRSRAQRVAAEERETASYAAFAFLAEHHEEIVARAPAGVSEGVVAQARRLLRAAFPDEQQARVEVARQLSALDAVLDVPDAPDQAHQLGQHGQVWMALGRVEEALRALTWNQPAPSDEMATGPALAPPLLRIGPEGGPYRVTADPRQALSAWTQQDRPGPDTLFPANPVRIEECEAGGRWRQRSPRSLVEQVRSSITEPREHWEVDRELAQWLLADEPEGLHPEEMGARWSRYLGEVPPRGPVLAWVTRLAFHGVETSDMLARIQRGAAAERDELDWALGSTRQRRAIYRPDRELAEATELAAMDDIAIDEIYPGPAADELGARPALAPRATILASATVGDTRYTHAEFTRPPRRAVIVHTDNGFPAPYRLADSRLTDTDVLFTQLTSPEGRALAAAEGTGTAQRAAMDAADRVWEVARRAEQSTDLQLELVELAEQAQSGELDAAAYAQRAGQVWDELFPLLEGRGPRDMGESRRWYAVRVAGDDTAWGTLTADPLEAVVQWAQHDRPLQQYVILTGTAGTVESTETSVGGLLAQAWQETANGPSEQEERLGQALAGWLDRARQSVAVHIEDGQDPAAWRQAGWAWRGRVGESLPQQVSRYLDPMEAREVARGEQELGEAVDALNPDYVATAETVRGLYQHWKILSAAAVNVEQVRPHAREALDALIFSDQRALWSALGDDQGPRQACARLWYLSRELGRQKLLPAFMQVAAPDRVVETELPATLGALPQRLRDAPEAAQALLATAERAVGHQALESLYVGYPDAVREEKGSAAQDASTAVFLQAAAEATRGQTASRVHGLQARHAPGPAAPAGRAGQNLDAAQQAAVHPASSPQSPTVR
jgi:hypothetical protein